MYKYFIYIFILAFNQLMAQPIGLPAHRPIAQNLLKSWTNNGLPSNSTTDIIQTTDGYIWVATYGGLAVFDGLRFRKFTPRNVPQMASYAIQSLQQDSNNVLWIGTQRGLLSYNNHRFDYIPAMKELENENIERLFVDKHNRLWIGTNRAGIYCYDQNTLKCIDKQLTQTDVIMTIAQDHDQRIWFGAEGGAVFLYDKNLYKMPFDFSGIYDISTDKKQRVWLCTDKGIFFYDGKQLIRPKQPNVRITNHVIHDQHGFWAATIEGLYRYVVQKDTFFLHNESSGLPNNIVNRLLSDNLGNIWGATYRQGIFMLSDSKFTCFSTIEGTSSSTIVDIEQIDDSTYWLANENTAIDILCNGKITTLKTVPRSSKMQLRDIMHDSQGNIWISYYGGVRKISANGQQQWFDTSNVLLDNLVRLAYQDKYGAVWLGTRSGGLYKYQTNDKFLHIGNKQGLSSDFVMCIKSLNDNGLAVGTKHGFDILYNDTVRYKYAIEQGLPSNLVFAIHADTDNVLWIATNAGISRFDGKRFFNINVNNGLTDDYVFDIHEDKYGFLWMPTNSGIMYVDKKELNLLAQGKIKKIKCRIFDRSDGMRSDQYIGASRTFADRNGTLWLPTGDGVASINPQNISETSLQVPAIINEIVADLDTSYFSEQITIKPDTRRTRIFYSALNYSTPDKVQFKYKLVPLDKDWVQTEERSATYTQLSPGQYTFYLTTINKDGIANSQQVVMQITVLPHWWQATWLKVATFSLVVFLVWLGFYNSRLRARHLEKVVKQRTRQVEKQKEHIILQSRHLQEINDKLITQTEELKIANSTKDKFFSILAHDLRNPVGSFKSATEFIADYHQQLDTQSIHNLAVEMKISAQSLYTLLENLLEWSRVQSGHIEHTPDNIDINNLTKQCIQLVNAAARDKKLTIETHLVPEMIVFADFYMISTVVRNLLSNAIKFTPVGGQITVSASAHENKCILDIADTGVGISPANIEKLFRVDVHHTTSGTNDEKGSGLGLVLCKEFIEKNNGTITVQSTVGKGTIFTVTLPLSVKKTMT